MEEDSPAYVYIATDIGLDRSYVGVSASLLSMDWIARYGVDHLVWFEGHDDVSLAERRAHELSMLTEDKRQEIIAISNPSKKDLTDQIWGLDYSK